MNIFKQNKISIKDQRGFISLFAVVVVVVVGGGTIYTGSKIIKKVHEKGCGEALGRWSSGQTYGDLGSIDNEEAIEDAMKCRDAMHNAVQTAKPVGSMMSGANNIGVSESNLGAVVVDRIMDKIDQQSTPGYERRRENNPLPDDVVDAFDKEFDNNTEDEGLVDKIIDKVEDIEFPDIDDGSSGEEKPQGTKTATNCLLGYTSGSAPKLKLDCPSDVGPGSKTKVDMHYSDPEGDIKSMVFRTVIKIPAYNGEQASPWTTVPFEETEKCGKSISPVTSLPEELGMGGVSTSFWFEAYLVDQAGNKSPVSSCKFIET